MKKLSRSQLGAFRKKSAQKGNPVVKSSIQKVGVNEATVNRASIVEQQHVFSHEIKIGKITDQKMSGRCWLFAGCNMLRERVAKKYKIKDFELSQNYLHFWDKLEKANYFLEQIIDTKNEESNSRVVQWLLSTLVEDGGQWDMFVNLVEKYGVVPKNAMPESYHSSNTRIMNQLLVAKLRGCAMELRKARNPEKKKEVMMSDIYHMLVLFLGEPPQKIHFEYRDDNGKFHSERGISPQDFMKKYVRVNLNDYISVVNAPAKGKPFNSMLTVQRLGNVVEGHPVRYLNIKNAELKKLALTQLLANETVWFGCDVGKRYDRKLGILDMNLFLYEEALGTSFALSKGDRIEYGDSQLTHAMLFTGVHVVKGKPQRWRVENSWGEKNILNDAIGFKGFFVMSDAWFDEYNFQVIIHKKHLSAAQKKVLTQEPIELPPWDPLGSLAIMH